MPLLEIQVINLTVPYCAVQNTGAMLPEVGFFASSASFYAVKVFPDFSTILLL
jgi:hypothetical protein